MTAQVVVLRAERMVSSSQGLARGLITPDAN
jgi:hypothetical protein